MGLIGVQKGSAPSRSWLDKLIQVTAQTIVHTAADILKQNT